VWRARGCGQRCSTVGSLGQSRTVRRRHVPPDRSRRHANPHLQEEFAGNPFLAPQRIGHCHLVNEAAQIGRQPRAPRGLDFQRHNNANPFRCHRSIVSGRTTARIPRQSINRATSIKVIRVARQRAVASLVVRRRAPAAYGGTRSQRPGASAIAARARRAAEGRPRRAERFGGNAVDGIRSWATIGHASRSGADNIVTMAAHLGRIEFLRSTALCGTLREVAGPRTSPNENHSNSAFALCRVLPIFAAACCIQRATKGQRFVETAKRMPPTEFWRRTGS
jgi:hypothetical protein